MRQVLAFRDRKTQVMQYSEEDLFSWEGASDEDHAEFACFEDDCFLKSINQDRISTFTSCLAGDYLQTDYTLDSRSCRQCPQDSKISTGVAQTQCESCADVKERLENETPLYEFYYLTLCNDLEELCRDDDGEWNTARVGCEAEPGVDDGGDGEGDGDGTTDPDGTGDADGEGGEVTPTDGDGTTDGDEGGEEDPDLFPDQDGEGTVTDTDDQDEGEDGEVTEEEGDDSESNKSLMTFIVLGGIIVGLILISFIVFKCYKTWCTKRVKVTQVEVVGGTNLRAIAVAVP